MTDPKALNDHLDDDPYWPEPASTDTYLINGVEVTIEAGVMTTEEAYGADNPAWLTHDKSDYEEFRRRTDRANRPRSRCNL